MLFPVSVLFFSPAGSTKKIALHLGGRLSEQVTAYDLARPIPEEHVFSKDDFAVAAVPVFMGRVPVPAAEALRRCRGDRTPVVSLAVYGGRAVEDALLELNDILTEQGFEAAASASFAAQHSMAGTFATGRPDADDFADMDAFAGAVLKKVAAGRPFSAPAVPGRRPYRALPPASGAVPLTSEACIQCGLCARECPAAAIPTGNPRITIPGKCFMCTRCLHICPQKARFLPPPVRAHVTELLSRTVPPRPVNETYL